MDAAFKKMKSKASLTSEVSPFQLALLRTQIQPLLQDLFSNALQSSFFPPDWMESAIIFIHKKGPKDIPDNHRTIDLEKLFLKMMFTLLAAHFSGLAEDWNLLPKFLFGFRRSRSTTSAATFLYEIVHANISTKKRVCGCFVDFSKAFDRVDRMRLFLKLQLWGIPRSICVLLANIYAGLKCSIRSGEDLSPCYFTSIGLPQGDPLSPILFNLYVSDLPEALSRQGSIINNNSIQYLQYADDLVLLADSAVELQNAINALHGYCQENGLQVNTIKTKAMVFHKGRLPPTSFHINNSPIEIVKFFNCVGFTFTTQLSFTKHLNIAITKAKARIGYIYNRLPIKNLPLPIVLQLFRTYITPIFLYGLHLWLPNSAQSALKSADATFTKFLKRYLCVPQYANNAWTHFICENEPFTIGLARLVSNSVRNLTFPEVMSGHLLSFPVKDLTTPYCPWPDIPSEYWRSRTFVRLPAQLHQRRELTKDLFNLTHPLYCNNQDFHHLPLPNCICSVCQSPLPFFHVH